MPFRDYAQQKRAFTGVDRANPTRWKRSALLSISSLSRFYIANAMRFGLVVYTETDEEKKTMLGVPERRCLSCCVNSLCKLLLDSDGNIRQFYDVVILDEGGRIMRWLGGMQTLGQLPQRDPHQGIHHRVAAAHEPGYASCLLHFGGR